MARKDHTRLSFFQKADELVVEVYRMTESMESSSGSSGCRGRGAGADLRDSIRSQTRAAVNAIVEACRGERRGEFGEMLECAIDHATDARYSVSIAGRLGQFEDHESTLGKFDALIRELTEEASKT